ncbi:helix-turn-helix domain-containing protein [Nitrospiraceae bacterium AH_259_D15_M11_P09]|nr:helix-turn-helix domain-containing protein [Nitrospiraceae bacterium AH_259_D15_M11_P09]
MTPRRLGTVLSTLRKGKQLTQDQLAARGGVTKPYVSQLESGARKNPSLATLKRLAKALGVPVAELMK